MWAQLFDRDMCNFLIACACFGAAWGFFELAARSALARSINPHHPRMS